MDLSNTRMLETMGNWKLFFIEGNPKFKGQKDVIISFITKDNINDLIKDNNMGNINVLSIDIDGNDYWVWEAMECKPELVIIEYNNSISLTECRAIEYNAEHLYKDDDYFGATWTAYKKLGEKKGYHLVDSNRLNMFFVRQDLINKISPIRDGLPQTVCGHPHNSIGKWIEL